MRWTTQLVAAVLPLLFLPASVMAVTAKNKAPSAAELEARRPKGVKIKPKKLDFGIVPIGERRALTFSVDNFTDAPVAFNLEDPPEPFQFSAGTPHEFVLIPGDYIVVGVDYVSADEGRHSGTIFVNSTYDRQPIQTVELKGRGGPESDLNVLVRPQFVDYGFSPPDQGNPAFFTFENIGDTPRDVQVEIGGYPIFHFSDDTRKKKFTLAPGETKNFIVGYHPMQPGTYKGFVVTTITNVGRRPRAIPSVPLFGRCVRK